MVLAGCGPQGPPTPITSRDALNPSLELTLEDGGGASVSAFPAVEAGDCIEPNDWPSTILRDGEARWAIEKNGTLVVEGDGWVAQLHYVWRRANPDFTELRYPTCAGDALNDHFLLEGHQG